MRASAPPTSFRSGPRFHGARWIWRTCGAATTAWPIVVRAYSRVHDELVRAALAEPADFFYGGTSAVLAATAEAASRAGRHFALDLEDFHSGEETEPSLETSLASRVWTAPLSSAHV